LVKTDAYGNMEWNKTYGGPEYDVAYSVIQTTDGGYVLAGHTSSFASGDSDAWVIKTDENGCMEWNQTYGGPGYDEAFSVIQTVDGGYAVVGQTHSFSAGYADFWLVKTDEYGNMMWTQKYGGTEYDIPSSVIQTSDGGYALAGTTNDTPRPEIYDFWLVKTDAYGNMEWSKQYGGLDQEHAYSVIQTSDGGYALAGDTNLFDADGRDVWLVKTDAHGNMEWSKTYDGPGADVAYSLVQTSDEGYIMAGETTFFASDDSDFWVIKTDKFGFVDDCSW
jgi:hypothetical protein